jgi:nicotinate-nucleotide adenylyltransferase
VAVVADVADHIGLDRVLWIPAREPPHKPGLPISPPEVRLEMVREAIVSDPRFEVSTLEIERDGPSYSVDTVRAVHEELPGAELWLIIGADEFRQFDTWRAPEEIVRHVRLAAMDRQGESAQATAASVTGGQDALFVPVQRIDVSSTAIRTAVREGRDVDGQVPSGVAAIIGRERLYSDEGT